MLQNNQLKTVPSAALKSLHALQSLLVTAVRSLINYSAMSAACSILILRKHRKLTTPLPPNPVLFLFFLLKSARCEGPVHFKAFDWASSSTPKGSCTTVGKVRQPFEGSRCSWH
ncbi:uncharacterized [Tachysurus ichikawai]